MNKVRTIDEYFLEKLETAEKYADECKEVVDSLRDKISKLEQIPEKEETEMIVETSFKCYTINTISSYNINNYIKDEYNNLDFMQKCLENDENIKMLLDNNYWKPNNYYSPKISERLYNYQINFFGTIVGIYIHSYDKNFHADTYVVDNVSICDSLEKAQEQLVIKQREEINAYIKKLKNK